MFLFMNFTPLIHSAPEFNLGTPKPHTQTCAMERVLSHALKLMRGLRERSTKSSLSASHYIFLAAPPAVIGVAALFYQPKPAASEGAAAEMHGCYSEIAVEAPPRADARRGLRSPLPQSTRKDEDGGSCHADECVPSGRVVL